MKGTLVLIDGHAMLYRAWFAFPKNLTKRDGTIVNAVYGFTRILLNVIAELKPEYLVVSFDVGKTFRHEQFKEYKAQRQKMPDELRAQEPLTRQVVTALNLPIITCEGFEADDVIGTLATQAQAKELETTIVTGDKDSFQLVADPFIKVYMPAKINKPATIYGEENVLESMGIKTTQITDFKGLAGDNSDNIPGVRGVGPKTAVALLNKFETVENLYKSLDDLSSNKENIGIKPAVLEKLLASKEMALESKRLATIVRTVPVNLDLELARVKGYNKQEAAKLLEEFEFHSLLSKLPRDEFEESVQEALF